MSSLHDLEKSWSRSPAGKRPSLLQWVGAGYRDSFPGSRTRPGYAAENRASCARGFRCGSWSKPGSGVSEPTFCNVTQRPGRGLANAWAYVRAHRPRKIDGQIRENEEA